MSHISAASRRAILATFVALVMAFIPASWGAATAASQGNRPGSTVVGKSEAGKITSKVIGRTADGDKVAGSFTPIRVVKRDGVLAVKGFLRGVIKNTDGPNTRFSGIETIPVKKVNGVVPSEDVLRGRAECDILNLVLGPLDLNLLGLEIHLQRVVLDIVAVSGAGQLLGNLLCAVAGLLDGGPLAGLLTQLQGLLNQILGLLNLGV